jgi:putative ABC transport system permease protein
MDRRCFLERTFPGFVRAPILQLQGSSWKTDGSGRANNVQLLGLNQTFFQSSSTNAPSVEVGTVWINQALAKQLQAKPGDTLLFRLAKPTALSPEVALVARDEATTTLRLTVAGIAPPEWADFSLQIGINSSAQRVLEPSRTRQSWWD